MDIAKLEKLLADGHDNAMLRFGLGKACFDAGEWEKAQQHLSMAVRMQPDYSAAWQLLGQALHSAGSLDEALIAFDRGLECAKSNGDQQALKAMHVMKKRVLKELTRIIHEGGRIR